jgi:RsiW-degrading membrane proteinase PrsW (M82 family)
MTRRALLTVALLFSSLYVLVLVRDAARPHIEDGQPLLSFFEPELGPPVMKVTFWIAFTGWLIALAVAAITVARRRGYPLDRLPSGPALTLVASGALLAPFTVFPLWTLLIHPLAALACVPSTAVGLWTVTRFQHWRHVPRRIVLGVFAFGAVLAGGLGAAMNTVTMFSGTAYHAGAGNLATSLHLTYADTFLSAGTTEELGKGAAVALAYVLARRHWDGTVSGVVLGGAAGLGFNFTETVDYMGAGGSDFQFWVRQSFALLAAHTAYSALLGAGFGVATLLARRRDRILAVAAGFVAASGAHFAADVFLRAFSVQDLSLPLDGGPVVTTLLLQPLTMLLVQGPFVLLYIVLLRQGTRDQAVRVADDLRAASEDPHGGVRPEEVPMLLDPRRRLRLRLKLLRRRDWRTLRALGRLHKAQFELAHALRRDPARTGDCRRLIAHSRDHLRLTLTGAPS